MKDTLFASPELEPALAALAVFGQADGAALTALLGQDSPVYKLADAPSVSAEDDKFTLAADAALEILGVLERDDLPQYRLLHAHAVAYLAERLRAGEETVEATLLAVFERLANRLLKDDPQGFIELVDRARDLPLQTPAGRHQRSYFEGVALRKAERYTQALDVFDALLAEPGLALQVRGRTLNSRANCCCIIGELEQALTGYHASLGLWRQLGDRLNEGKVLLNMGIVAYDLQDYEEAKARLLQAEVIFEQTGSAQWYAAVQNELGLVYRDQGHWSKALLHFERLLAQRRAEGAQDAVGRGLNNVGEVLLFQGRLEQASETFQQALEKMSTRIYRIDAHLNLGLAHQAAGDLTQAQAAFQAALALALDIGRRDILPHIHYRLGDVLRRQGDDAGALEQFRAGAEVVETTRSPLKDEELKISLLGRWQQIYEALVLHCLDQGRPAEAFEWAERARARAFADAVMTGTSSFPISSPGEKAPGVSSKLPESEVVGMAEAQAGLPADAALLCYFSTGVLDRDLPLLQALAAHNPLREHLLTPARTLLFVLTRAGLTVHECSINPNAFATASPRRGDRERFLAPDVRRRLYDILLEPASDALTTARLYIIPHGPLHHVPFGALTARNGQALVHSGGPHLAYAPSVTVLLRHCLALLPQERAPEPCLAVGYDGTTPERTLRHTEAEAAFVARLTRGVAWVGPQPKKEQLQAAASDQRWLHFACHGRFNYETPLDSYLETGAEERLTARKVLQNWRLQANLVTLSACQTGVSRILRGDEPMGLMRAFLYAGARAVLASQWPVQDLPTFLLMQRFYSVLQQKDSVKPSAALHTAQEWLRELSAQKVQELLPELPDSKQYTEYADLPPDARPFAHPRFWAAFILVGA